MADWQRIDLHTHSTCSDGTLAPEALVALAAQRRVELLALTDHDTLEGCAAARAACAASGITFIDGAELTCQWREQEIHVVGLRLDAGAAALRAYLQGVLERRRSRITGIGARLTQAGMNGEELAARTLAEHAVPTRMHLARLLVDGGHATDTEDAFKRHLSRGRKGHVRGDWPALEAAVTAIAGAGGVAVLAHPHRYRLSAGGLKELCAAFCAAGGAGIEVSLAGMSPGDADRMAALARRFGLAGSVGSDFHVPGLPWRPLGRFAKLPDQIAPITARLMT